MVSKHSTELFLTFHSETSRGLYLTCRIGYSAGKYARIFFKCRLDQQQTVAAFLNHLEGKKKSQLKFAFSKISATFKKKKSDLIYLEVRGLRDERSLPQPLHGRSGDAGDLRSELSRAAFHYSHVS